MTSINLHNNLEECSLKIISYLRYFPYEILFKLYAHSTKESIQQCMKKKLMIFFPNSYYSQWKKLMLTSFSMFII